MEKFHKPIEFFTVFSAAPTIPVIFKKVVTDGTSIKFGAVFFDAKAFLIFFDPLSKERKNAEMLTGTDTGTSFFCPRRKQVPQRVSYIQ